MSEQVKKKQAWRAIAFMLVVLAALPLAGCGKKPTQLDPPPGTNEDDEKFGRVYPNPSTDPKP